MEENKKYSILFVDDEENILKALKRLLRKEDYNFLFSLSGTEALQCLKDKTVHVVVSDHRMPQMSGIEFLRIVKDQYPDIIRIILTGYTDIDTITEAINNGYIYKFLLKPWNDENLKLEIKNAIAQYEIVQDNKKLHQKILEQGEELKKLREK